MVFQQTFNFIKKYWKGSNIHLNDGSKYILGRILSFVNATGIRLKFNTRPSLEISSFASIDVGTQGNSPFFLKKQRVST